MRTFRRAVPGLVAVFATLAMVACGGPGADVDAVDSLDVAGDLPDVPPDGESEASDNPCPEGQAPGAMDACISIGPEDCAPMFRDGSGLCHPTMDSCAASPGTVPRRSAKCSTVGIRGCPASFIDVDGLCRPTLHRCTNRPGTIPDSRPGAPVECAPVGIQGCAPEFIDADGLCKPPVKIPEERSDSFPVPSRGWVSLGDAAACGEGTWGTIPDDPERNVYVNPSASAEGHKGTRDDPVRAIADVFGSVPPNGRIILAEGIYPESLVFGGAQSGYQVVGRCASKVTLAGSGTASVIKIISASDIRIQGVTIDGSATAVEATKASNLQISGVRIRNAKRFGIVLSGATPVPIEITDSLVQGTSPPAEGDLAVGLRVTAGTTAHLRGTALLGNQGFGLVVQDPASRLEVRDSVIGDTGGAGGSPGMGIVVMNHATALLEGSAVRSSTIFGVNLQRRASESEEYKGTDLTTLTANYNLVEGTRASAGQGATGLLLDLGAEVFLTGNAVVDNQGFGLIALAGSAATLSGNLLARNRGANNGMDGAVAAKGANLSLNGDALSSNRNVGILAQDPSTFVSTLHVLVEGTVPSDSGKGGDGVMVSGGATAKIVDSGFVANSGSGWSASGAPQGDGSAEWTLDASNSLVEDTRPAVYGAGGTPVLVGQGVFADGGATVSLQGNAILGSRELGISLLSGTVAELTGNLVQGTRPAEAASFPDAQVPGTGIGLFADASRVTSVDDAFADNRGAGILLGSPLVGSADGEVVYSFDGLLVQGTRANPSDGRFGMGLVATAGARVRVTNAVLTGNQAAGIAADGVATNLSVAGSIIEETDPEETTDLHLRGEGALFQNGVTFDLAHLRVRASSGVGVFVHGSTGTITESIVEDVQGGYLVAADAASGQTYGDCLQVVQGASVRLEASKFQVCARVGVLYSGSAGSLEGCEIRDNELGLVLRGTPTPDFDPVRNRVEGNRSMDVADDSMSAEVDCSNEAQPLPEWAGGQPT